jgi:hypothetical protein
VSFRDDADRDEADQDARTLGYEDRGAGACYALPPVLLIALGRRRRREYVRPGLVMKEIDDLTESADRWQINFRGSAIRGHGDGSNVRHERRRKWREAAPVTSARCRA